MINFDKATLHKYLKIGAYPTDTVRHLVYKMLEDINN
jgi:ribosomal protein S16